MDAIVARARSAETSECDNRQSENLDMKQFTGRTDRLKIQTAVMPQTKIELASRDGLLHRIGVTIELGSDRRTDEVGTIGVETLPDEKIDVPQIDEANVDRELFTIDGSGWDFISHLSSIYHLPRGYMDGGLAIARARCGPYCLRDRLARLAGLRAAVSSIQVGA